MNKIFTPVFAIFILAGIASLSFINKKEPVSSHRGKINADTLHYPAETHFKNIQQLTFGGDNAEAYWSYDSKWLVFQRTSAKDGIPCDQIFIGKVPEKAGDKFEY